jgi:hypothetical protein
MEALKASTTSIKPLIEATVAMKHHVCQTEAPNMEVEYYDNNEQGVEWPITAYQDYTHADGFSYAVPSDFEFSSCSL